MQWENKTGKTRKVKSNYQILGSKEFKNNFEEF